MGSNFDFRLKFWFSWQNLDFLVKISIFESEFRVLSQIAIFVSHFDIRLNFRFLCKISIYMSKFRICFIFRFSRTKKLFGADGYRILKFSVYIYKLTIELWIFSALEREILSLVFGNLEFLLYFGSQWLG